MPAVPVKTRGARLCPVLLLVAAAAVALPGRAVRPDRRAGRQPREKALDPDRINDATLTPAIGPGAHGSAVLRAQILLDRAHFSCGEIDASYGQSLRGAVAAFQRAQGRTPTGVLDPGTWTLLNRDGARALTSTEIAPEDVAGPFTPIPDDLLEKAKLPVLGFTSSLEGLAEKYHASPVVLRRLNPNASFDRSGEEILVPDVSSPLLERAATIVVSQTRDCVEAIDTSGRVIAHFPASTGSRHDPLPLGRWKVVGVAHDPVFHYDSELFWDAPEHQKAVLAAGPNNPVGVCWIDLSKPHYGIHGTPEPSHVGKTQSHGCIRLTNWDVRELAQIVRPGTPVILEK